MRTRGLSLLGTLFTIVITGLASGRVEAFPQLSRHGYFNCTACHVSPTGGGHLNSYGRQLSAELVSAASTKNEELPFYGLMGNSETLTLQAYLRGLQMVTDSSQMREARAILMQADFEAAYRIQSWTGVLSLGRREIVDSGEKKSQVWSRNHYLMWSNDSGLNVRFGQFMPGWGLNHPNHSLFVRRDLGFGQDTERNTIEASYLGDGQSWIVNYIAGRDEDPHAKSKEKAASLTYQHGVGENSRWGAGYYRGQNQGQDRSLVNGFGMFDLGHHFFTEVEADYQWRQAQQGSVLSSQWGWEFSQGMIPYLALQWEQLDRSQAQSRAVAKGLGFNYYPRPHIEMQVYLGDEKHADGDPVVVGLAMLNYYL